jgi:hypothetical protein
LASGGQTVVEIQQNVIPAGAQGSLFDPTQSSLTLKVGSVPSVMVPAQAAGVSLSPGVIQVPAGVFQTVGLVQPVNSPLLSILGLTLSNAAATFTSGFSAPNPVGGNLTSPASTPLSHILCPGGCNGGFAALNGAARFSLLGFPVTFSLGVIGGGGAATAMVGVGKVTLTGGPWISGSARITNIQTTVISLPGRGGATGIAFTLDPTISEQVRIFTTLGSFLTFNPGANVLTRSTARAQGSNALTPTASGVMGTLQMIVPARINLSPFVASKPAMARMTLTFLPEPGVFSLLSAGAALMALLGRARIRR